MYLKDIINIIGNYNVVNKKINNIVTDSRLVSEGDVFISINDGYKYISDAVKRGAYLIITEKYSGKYNVPIIKVNDSIYTLGLIAKYLRSKYNGIVIAITGSNGKTTTKELLSYVLKSKYKVLYNKGSENNNIGVPNTLLSINNEYNYVVLELGTNHKGEIRYLTDIVKPDISIITNIGSSHIGNFGSIDNIYKEKLDIYNNNILFVNGEDKYLNELDCFKVFFNDYDYKCSVNHLQIDYNLVIRVCLYLGMSYKDIVNRLDSFILNMSRMSTEVINNVTIIDDSYNASYESVVAGLSSLPDNRKIIILGSMLELGNYSYYYHNSLNDIFNKMNNYYLITIGEDTKVIKSNKHFDNIDDLIDYVLGFNYIEDDIIYIKGAHKYNLYQVVNAIKGVLQNR